MSFTERSRSVVFFGNQSEMFLSVGVLFRFCSTTGEGIIV